MKFKIKFGKYIIQSYIKIISLLDEPKTSVLPTIENIKTN